MEKRQYADLDKRLCKRCQQPVKEPKCDYELFEEMHWACFHMEFEHDTDHNVLCHDPSCPLR